MATASRPGFHARAIVDTAAAREAVEMTEVILGMGAKTSTEGYLEVNIEKISEHDWNAREFVPESATDELAMSIQSSGQMVPIAAYLEEGRFVLVDGQRRLRALRSMGAKTVKVSLVARPENELEVYKRSRMANVQRAEQTPLDDAVKWRKLLDAGIYESNKQLADDLGISEAVVSKTLGLLEIPRTTMKMLIDRPSLLSLRMLYALAQFRKATKDSEEGALEELLLTVDKQGLSARDVEAHTKKIATGPKKKPRSLRKGIQWEQGTGELRRFDTDGRIEFVMKNLSPEKLEQLEEALLRVVSVKP